MPASSIPKTITVVKGQVQGMLSRAEFRVRFQDAFKDSRFEVEGDSLARIEEIAWSNYQEGRKAPRTRKAGPGYADPEYELSLDWLETRQRIEKAERERATPSAPSRVLVINASPRNDGTCPGEVSKTWRLAQLVCETLEAQRVTHDLLDLSLLTSDYGRHIHPCKGCVSTAMPLCHWPCSCYPNHALRQTGDWMNDIYVRWTGAHGVVILAPVHWYQATSPLKLMMDRLVCADGGNPDPTSTGGKDPEKAKALEMEGWPYPKHLAGRAYGVVVHGDVAGIEGTRRALSDWLDWMGLIDAGFQARLDRFVGYYEPYATSHQVLDKDSAVQEETRNVARAVAKAVAAVRAGDLKLSDERLRSPRPK